MHGTNMKIFVISMSLFCNQLVSVW